MPLAWVYDASGNKLKKVVKSGSTIQYTQHYVQGIEYRQGSTGTPAIEAIYHPEGRVFYTSATASRYEYSIRDHLGNTRITFSDLNANNKVDVNLTANEVLQENHYYPFGLGTNGAWMNNASSLDNLYQYNGKELNNDWGLNLYDYGFRWSDPALGRFVSVDPLADKFPELTTYQYASNTPVGSIDLDGLESLRVEGDETAVNKFKEEVGRSSGGFLKATMDEQGRTTFERTDAQGTPTERQKAFMEILESATDPEVEGEYSISLVESSEVVEAGEIGTHEIDIDDIQAIGSGEFVSSAGAFAHELVEQKSSQILNLSDKESHDDGIQAENYVNGSIRGPLKTSSTFMEVQSPQINQWRPRSGHIDVSYTKGARSMTVVYIFYRSNIIDVIQE